MCLFKTIKKNAWMFFFQEKQIFAYAILINYILIYHIYIYIIYGFSRSVPKFSSKIPVGTIVVNLVRYIVSFGVVYF